MSAWVFGYHVGVSVVLAAVFVSMVANLSFFRSIRVGARRVGPRVSVLVPARNEEGRVGRCLASLALQDYGEFEVIVLDDHSEDRTAEIARGLGFVEGGEKLRLVSGRALPEGWTGKSWACSQLAEVARGDYLLFTDADTWHAPGALGAAVEMAEAARADLLSAWPRLVTGTLGEKLVIPLIHLLAVAVYPHALLTVLQRVPRLAAGVPRGWLRQLGAANGQYMLFRREAYERIGGHASVKGHLVEDVALGREIAKRVGEGMRLVNCDGSGLVECRMYESFGGVWEGFTKNLRAAFEGSVGAFVGTGLMQGCAFLLPFVLLPFSGEWRGWVLGQIGVIYLIRGVLTARFRTSWAGCVGHPIGLALALAIGLNSWRKSAGRGVSWKGRVYRVGE